MIAAIHYHECSVCTGEFPCNAPEHDIHDRLCDFCLERWQRHAEVEEE